MPKMVQTESQGSLSAYQLSRVDHHAFVPAPACSQLAGQVAAALKWPTSLFELSFGFGACLGVEPFELELAPAWIDECDRQWRRMVQALKPCIGHHEHSNTRNIPAEPVLTTSSSSLDIKLAVIMLLA